MLFGRHEACHRERQQVWNRTDVGEQLKVFGFNFIPLSNQEVATSLLPNKTAIISSPSQRQLSLCLNEYEDVVLSDYNLVKHLIRDTKCLDE